MFEKLLSAAEKVNRRAILVLAVVWMAVTGWLDYKGRLEISLFAVYWPAICLVTWTCGASWGYSLGVASVLLVAADDFALGRAQRHLLYFYTEVIVRFLSFLLFVWLLSRLRSTFEREAELRRESDAAATLKSDMLSLMSHEINNAIAVLKMTVFLMRENETTIPPKRRDSYDIIERVLLNMELAARNFLSNARLQAGRLTLQAEPFELAPLVENTIRAFTPLFSQKSVTVVIDAQGRSRVLADRAALSVVLSNLISNAVKYTPPKGQVTVRIAESKEQKASVKVSVIDTGIGVSVGDRDRMFEAFVRLPEGKVMAKGYGLGLKTAHDLLQLHGSHLELDSVKGKGSTFSFTLPIARS